MSLNLINPTEIQREESLAKNPLRAKADFGDFLGGVSALTPFAAEFTRQSTGSVNAATVLNAAFTSFPAAAGAFSGSGGAPSWANAGYSVPYGPPGTYPGGIPGLDFRAQVGGWTPAAGGPPMVSGAGGGSQVVPGTNMSQFQLMEIMNQNNLQLIELQALMQSNMQVWNTKSNILSADNRAKLSMIEKFTAR